MNQYRNHHEREAARLRLLLANATTPRVKARLSQEVEKLAGPEDLNVPAVPYDAACSPAPNLPALMAPAPDMAAVNLPRFSDG